MLQDLYELKEIIIKEYNKIGLKIKSEELRVEVKPLSDIITEMLLVPAVPEVVRSMAV